MILTKEELHAAVDMLYNKHIERPSGYNFTLGMPLDSFAHLLPADMQDDLRGMQFIYGLVCDAPELWTHGGMTFIGVLVAHSPWLSSAFGIDKSSLFNAIVTPEVSDLLKPVVFYIQHAHRTTGSYTTEVPPLFTVPCHDERSALVVYAERIAEYTHDREAAFTRDRKGEAVLRNYVLTLRKANSLIARNVYETFTQDYSNLQAYSMFAGCCGAGVLAYAAAVQLSRNQFKVLSESLNYARKIVNQTTADREKREVPRTTLPATPTQRTSLLRTEQFTARLEMLYRCTEELNMSLFCTVLNEEFGERVTLSKLTPQSSVGDALIVRKDDGEYMCLWASNGTSVKREAGDKLHSFDPHNKHNIEHLLTCYTLHRKRKEAEKCSRSTSRQH